MKRYSLVVITFLSIACAMVICAESRYRVDELNGNSQVKVGARNWKKIMLDAELKGSDEIYVSQDAFLRLEGEDGYYLINGVKHDVVSTLICEDPEEVTPTKEDINTIVSMSADTVGVREITEQDAKNKPKVVMTYFYDNGRRLFAHVKRYDMDKSVSFEITERENILNHLDSCKASKKTKSIYNTPQLYQMLWKNMAQYFKEDDIISYTVPQYLYGIDMRYLPMNEKQRMGHLFYMFSPGRR